MGTTSKALTLLDHFTRLRPQIGLSELARLSGTSKATCYRLMSELVAHGLAEQVAAGREYRIGPAVLRLAALREAAVPTREAAMPVLQALAAATGETAHMSHLVAGRLTTLAFAYSSAHGMRIMMEDADILPFHATSSGIVVLAFLPAPEREAILARPLPRLTAATETDPERLRRLVAEARARGFAETADTFEVDVRSAAAPLFDAAGACDGAVAVAAPASRMTEALRNRIVAAVSRAAADITAIRGGTLPPDLPAP